MATSQTASATSPRRHSTSPSRIPSRRCSRSTIPRRNLASSSVQTLSLAGWRPLAAFALCIPLTTRELAWHPTWAPARRRSPAWETACPRRRRALEVSWPSTRALASRSSALSAIAACSLAPSTPLPASTPTRTTRASLVPCPPFAQPRRPSRSAPVRLTPLILFADAFRCSRRSLWRSIFTRAPWTVSRRLQQRRAWRRGSTKASLQMWSAAWAEPWFSCSTTGPRTTSASELTSPIPCVSLMPSVWRELLMHVRRVSLA
mmetsp:Transcript_11052/g.35014  ORF Transcript_11052/g.35014 Transcript_11052/m.35014 type:complete len:261 (+) Transcript_11052:304-1086(+)